MAEVLSNIYDLVYTSPSALRDLASIEFAANLWRKRIIEDSSTDISEEVSLLSELPSLPSTILPIIERYFQNIRISSICRRCSDEVGFDCLIYNFNGGIDYDKLAKQVVFCEKISEIGKFKIACTYCLKDDIIRIWPSVSNHFNLGDLDFRDDPLLYYWICCLKNELHKMPLSDYGYDTIDGREMEFIGIKMNWSSVEYFWNRLKFADRMRNAAFLLKHNSLIFCRYILARLNKEELKILMTERGDSFLCTLLNGAYHPEYREKNMPGICILAAWEYLKHELSHTNFICAVREIIKKQTESLGGISTDQYFSYKFWDTTADHLKQIAIGDVLLEQSLYTKSDSSIARGNWLILSVLKDASLEARSTFWHKNWRTLLPGTKAVDLKRFLILCCKNEEEIILFKNNNLSKYENIKDVCLENLKNYRFDEVNEYISLCCLEKETIHASRLRLLTDYVNSLRNLYNNRIFLISVDVDFVRNIHSLNTFVEDACNDDSLAADFKSQIMLAPRTLEILTRNVASNTEVEKVMQFVDLFAASEPAAIDFKQRHFMPSLMNLLSTGRHLSFHFDSDSFASFMRWCFESEDKMAEFKRTVSIDEIVSNVTQCEEEASHYNAESYDDEPYPYERALYSDLAKFLEWFFSSPEEIAQFKKKFYGFEKYTPKNKKL